jgi:hypothetical protein
MKNFSWWLIESVLFCIVAGLWVWSFRRLAQSGDTSSIVPSPKAPLSGKEVGRKRLFTAFLWAVVAWIWAWSFSIFTEASASLKTIPDMGSLFTALFGASSIALFILSLLVAGLAIVGWQSVKEYIEERVEKTATDKSRQLDQVIRDNTQALEKALRGRVATILGYTIGEMSLKPGSFEVQYNDRLSEAVEQCKEGYKFLKEVGGGAEYLGLNNLVFYTCLLEEGRPKEDEEWMLASARKLLVAGQEKRSNMLKLTACRVLLEHEASSDEKRRARNILEAIASGRTPASIRETNEARFYLLEKYPEGPAPTVRIDETRESHDA